MRCRTRRRAAAPCAWAAAAPALPSPARAQPRAAPRCAAHAHARPEPHPPAHLAPAAGIVADRLSLWWPDGTPALRDVSFRVPPGTLAMVAGANGSGKSTLLAALHGLRLPDLGSARADAPCAFVYQDAQRQLLLPNVATNVAVSVPETDARHAGHGRADERSVRAAVLRALDDVGFRPPDPWMGKRARDLSGGEKQRVAIAAALVMRPRSILFDEVTASMDAANRALLLDLIPAIVAERKIAALWVTHTREELKAADMIILLNKGIVVAVGSPDEVIPIIDSNTSMATFFSEAADDFYP